jgi:hypothetical protein
MKLLAAVIRYWSYSVFDRLGVCHFDLVAGDVCLFTLRESFGLDLHTDTLEFVSYLFDSVVVFSLILIVVIAFSTE